jgi:hypothetical protein
MGPLEWAQRYRQIDGKPFSLARFTPLKALYADEHPHIVVIKPAQRGVSEYAINYTGFALDRGADVWTKGEKEGLNVAYIFPKKESLGDFSKERLSGLMHESSYLERLFGDDEFNAVTFKQVGGSYLYLRGGWSTSALKSFPADVLILDEFDEMAPSAIALARRRLNASLVRRELDISTPSHPGTGIHGMYLQSDRHVYEQLHGCDSWVRYDFLRDCRVDGQAYDTWQQWPPEHIRRLRVTLACPACGGDVSEGERIAEGRWVAEEPEVEGLRGYWIPPLAWPGAELLKRLATAAVNPDPSEREQFFQQDLGLPYSVGGSKLTPELIMQLASGLETGHLPNVSWRDTTMGVDVGSRWHYKVSSTGPDGRRYVRAAGAAHSWEDLDALMSHFRVRHCVVDALPELDGSKRFSARWPGRVLRAFYPGPAALKGQLFHLDGFDPTRPSKRKRRPGASDVVQVNRTMAMDRIYAMVVRCEELWPLEILSDPELLAHLQSPTRTLTLDAHGQETAGWTQVGPDHLYHACVYDLVARETLPPASSRFQGAAGGARPQLTPPGRAGSVGAPPQAPRQRTANLSRQAALRQILVGARGGRIGTQFGSPLSGLGRRNRNRIV